MAARVYLDEIELELSPLEAAAGSPASIDPLPRLKVAGPPKRRKFETIVMENELMRAALAPELGGRLISLFDKRTGQECLLKSPSLSFAEGGDRGIYLPAGISWPSGEFVGRMSMAEVSAQIIEADDEDSTKCALFGFVPGLGLSWHLFLELPPDRAEIRAELRAFNRNLEAVPYRGGILLGDAASEVGRFDGSIAVWDAETRCGVALHFLEGDLDGTIRTEFGQWADRPFPNQCLAPRQTDHWTFRLSPISGIGAPFGISAEVAIGLDGASLKGVPAGDYPGSKIFLSTSDGQTLESEIDLRADTPFSMDLPSEIEIRAILVRDADRNTLLHAPSAGLSETHERTESLVVLEGKHSKRDPARRAAAWLAQAHAHLEAGEPQSSLDSIEEALLFNGDDPLAWWLKDAAGRLGGTNSEGGAIENAHYLAPMEPMLRVAAFLNMPDDPNGAPSALVKPIANDRELLVEGAATLIEAGFRADALRWIEEALRHQTIASLLLLRAWELARQGLKTEASIQIQAAEAVRESPPFPWRELELRAIRELSEVFPSIEWLKPGNFPSTAKL